MAKKATISVFGTKPENAIVVPELPLAVRNNCQSGKWTIGDEEYGSKLSMTILKFSKFFGSLGQTHNTLWGQIWFVAESGELPKGVVMVTYIKGRSLSDFNRLVASVQARGIEPAEGIFIPEFLKHSGQKPDETGVLKPINYYSLKWDWLERSEWDSLEQAAAVLSDSQNLSRMIDLESTTNMVCLDNLPPHEIACLMAAYSNGHDSQNGDLALPGGESEAANPEAQMAPAF
ncbi:hypothetical protein JJD41_21150 [Oxynema sp. CENA135]|uniref:hypothetical protein n=1 Tax=Oxynema sp. CENA135 TaxID=984206 RepID=UPI00190A2A5E|nr:hypothetical protein [Oxynema sp. CENA135]MBK4732354.1 hypothetical protein [Oxynema sp. CENA135]